MLEAGISNFNEPTNHIGSSWSPSGNSDSMFFINSPSDSVTGSLSAILRNTDDISRSLLATKSMFPSALMDGGFFRGGSRTRSKKIVVSEKAKLC